MLIQFSVGNFLSFKEVVTLSMVASSIKEHQETNVFAVNKLNLLKSAVLYGANASGKSNLFKAMNFAKNFILNSSKETQSEEPIRVRNFKLSNETQNAPSYFEIIFICEKIKYRYGFEADKAEVQSEWLYYTPKTKETKLFEREKNNFKLGTHFKEGEDFRDKTRKNALFLSVVAQFNGEISNKILKWIKNNYNIISSAIDAPHSNRLRFNAEQLKEPKRISEILNFLKIADLGIEDIKFEELKFKSEDFIESSGVPEELKNKLIEDGISVIHTLHIKYEKNKPTTLVPFILEQDESEGTKKIFALSNPILDALKNGTVLVIDEFDDRLHPIITKFLIKLFNSKERNPNNAQLIFTSHDTNFLNKNIFRRDQIWFAEKDNYGSTDLYSLVEYKVRKDASFDKDYILGKYGAIPFVGEPNFILMKTE